MNLNEEVKSIEEVANEDWHVTDKTAEELSNQKGDDEDE